MQLHGLRILKLTIKNKLHSHLDVSYFINKCYSTAFQVTREITTAYVLKKDEDYVGCLSIDLSKNQTCYIIELIRYFRKSLEFEQIFLHTVSTVE